MYHLYHTPAFVLGGAAFGEGSRYIALLTREFGLITARAQSVCEERSKLRYGLQEWALSEVTLVRGAMWRVTNAVLMLNIFTRLRGAPDAVAMFGRVFRLLRRLLPGEEKNEKLFSAVQGAFAFFEHEQARGGSVESVEIILVLRILYLLGYLAPQGECRPFVSDVLGWDASLLREAQRVRSRALASINQSLKASQL
ncbi:MAG: DNA repair protein RecO [Parcubacteria group bacterium Greene0416_79]|nr:MAG: DNA repair protein RecO [Parcubacteria group bacterium Greene0416_79]